MIDDVSYFSTLVAAAPPIRWKKLEPFRVTFKVGSPVCITTPWVSFDGLLSHLLLFDALKQDFFITPKKFVLSPHLPKNRRLLPLKKTDDVYHASVSQFIPDSLKVTQIYKRFEDKWAEQLDKKKIYVGSGTFRSYAIKEPYVACKEVVYYVCGDMDLIQRFIEEYLVGLGNDIRIGFGMIRDVIFERTEEDWSIIAGDIAMRPIPIEMCEEYEDAAYLPYRAPYWSPKNVVLCVPPGGKCKLKGEYKKRIEAMGRN